jgi:hypothetical protein
MHTRVIVMTPVTLHDAGRHIGVLACMERSHRLEFVARHHPEKGRNKNKKKGGAGGTNNNCAPLEILEVSMQITRRFRIIEM